MIKFLVDHCFDEDLLRAVKRQHPAFDGLLARDVGLERASDHELLAWAAKEGRVVLTHDRNTMTKAANDRLLAGELMSGLVVVGKFASSAALIEDILLVAECAGSNEWQGRTLYVPL